MPPTDAIGQGHPRHQLGRECLKYPRTIGREGPGVRKAHPGTCATACHPSPTIRPSGECASYPRLTCCPGQCKRPTPCPEHSCPRNAPPLAIRP